MWGTKSNKENWDYNLKYAVGKGQDLVSNICLLTNFTLWFQYNEFQKFIYIKHALENNFLTVIKFLYVTVHNL